MLDIRLIRENPEAVRENLARRHDHDKEVLLGQLIEDDAKWRELTGVVNDLRRRRNEISSEIADVMREEGDASSLREEASKIPKQIVDAETERDQYGGKVRAALMQLPNMLHESVPYGLDDGDNVELRKGGSRPVFDFEPKSHADVATALGILDLERAAKVSGSGFYYLRNELALLDYAIMNYTVSNLLKKGFALIEPPYMIRRKPYEGVVDLADFESVMYKIEDEDLYLIATSEHAVGSMLMDEVINAEDLPLKLCGVSPCFRKEVGTHGKYTKGLFRVHQFNKIEMFVFSLPEQSWEIHEELQQNCE